MELSKISTEDLIEELKNRDCFVFYLDRKKIVDKTFELNNKNYPEEFIDKVVKIIHNNEDNIEDEVSVNWYGYIDSLVYKTLGNY